MVTVPAGKLGQAITQFVRDTETELLFNHSSRVFQFGALAGQQRRLKFDPELLYAGAMFHDVGLMPTHSTSERFEVDGANAARDFLHSHGIAPTDIDLTYDQYSNEERNAVTTAFPRIPHFKQDILQAFYDGIKHKLETTFGNVKADVLALKDPTFKRGNFCSVILNSKWSA